MLGSLRRLWPWENGYSKRSHERFLGFAIIGLVFFEVRITREAIEQQQSWTLAIALWVISQVTAIMLLGWPIFSKPPKRLGSGWVWLGIAAFFANLAGLVLLIYLL